VYFTSGYAPAHWLLCRQRQRRDLLLFYWRLVGLSSGENPKRCQEKRAILRGQCGGFPDRIEPSKQGGRNGQVRNAG
jgi:hypothetical protein